MGWVIDLARIRAMNEKAGFRIPGLGSIQGRLTLFFLAFVLLILLSVGVTYWGIERQEKDALIINLAGRQRMLLQEMARLTQGLGEENNQGDLEALSAAEETFERTLSAFLEGGQAPYLPGEAVSVPAAKGASILEQLLIIQERWRQFQASLDQVRENQPGSMQRLEAVSTVEDQAPILVAEADLAVRLFEKSATRKVQLLRGLQIGFLVCAIALLAAGGWMTREVLIQPLGDLSRTAERMREGDLTSPVKVDGLQEIYLLSNTLESMRSELKSSQEALVTWSETLESRVMQRTRELEALYEISRDISSRLDVEQLLGAITERSLNLLGGDVAVLCSLDHDQELLVFEAHSGLDDGIRGDATDIAGEMASRVLSGKRAFNCGEEYCAGGCGILDQRYRTSHIAAPLWVEERLIGALCVGRSDENSFSLEATSLLTKLANSAAVALENARLYEQAEKVAALEERQRIAAEMHDGLGQTLSTLSIKIDRSHELIREDRAQEARRILDESYLVLDQAMVGVRRAIASLMEKHVPHGGLRDQLSQLVDEQRGRDGLEVVLKTGFEDQVSISDEDLDHILKVANEAMLNARRHAYASHLEVSLDRNEDCYILAVRDDGLGFDLQEDHNRKGNHFGIQVMEARAERIGGDLNIQTAPGEGTVITLKWPIHGEDTVT